MGHLSGRTVAYLLSSRAVVRSDGTVTGKYRDYRAFGMMESEGASLNQKYKYTGKPFDDEQMIEKMYYYGARYYWPSLGRFLAVDPLHEKYPTLSPYAYCANNPLTMIDPDGRGMVLSIDEFPSREKYKENLPDWVPDWAGDALYDMGTDPMIGPATIGGPAKNAAKPIFGFFGKILKRVFHNTASDMAKRMNMVRSMGKIGESMLEGTGKKTRIKSLSGTANFRVPDAIDDVAETLFEVKNITGKLSYTSQLKDYVLWTKKYNFRFKLIVNSKTRFTKAIKGCYKGK